MSSNAILFINLGSELLYVLEQRLRAHKVSNITYSTVILDIVSVLFNEKLLKEILDSGPTLWSPAEMRQILDKIVTSSLMRMDPLSMDKLWQLGTAVLRWQLNWTCNLEELTEAHMDGVALLCKSPQILTAHKMFKDLFGTMSPEKHSTVRHALVLWLNDHRTKVSLLIRLQLQKMDGSYCNPSESTNHFFQNLGENIYSFVASEEEDEDEQNEYNFEELNSLVCSVMAQQTDHRIHIKLPFLNQGEAAASSLTLERKVDKTLFETERNKNNNIVKQDLLSVTDPPAEQSSLHEDLINMLGD